MFAFILEVEGNLELLQRAGMIGVPVRQDAKLQIFVPVIHVLDRIHDDIGIGIGKPVSTRISL